MNKRPIVGIEEVKLFLFADDIRVYIEKPMESTKSTIKLN